MKSRLAYLRNLNNLQYALIALAGLSFWFVLGFPFANHNESYYWIVLFDKYGLFDILRGNTRPLAFATIWLGQNFFSASIYPQAIPNNRPLGFVEAWLGYAASGNSIYVQELLNFVGAILAWLILFSAIKEKKLFSWVSLIVGGGFFSGYIYLFHLHGVFYSPLLMFLAFLLARAIQNKSINAKSMLLVSALALVTSLFHPFAIPIYIGYLAGYVLENRHGVTRKQLIAASLFMLIAFGMIKVLVPSQGLSVTMKMLNGLFVSFDVVEINSFVSIASWLLCLLTVLSLNSSRFTKVAFGSIVTALSLAFVWLNWPVVIVWLFTSLLKTALMKKWTLGFLIMATAILPVASGTGSPTYTIFAIMTCTAVLPLGYSFFEKDSAIYDRMAFIPLILIVIVALLTRAGVQLPGISGLVRPVLAEKEKTHQLEDIIRWVASSDYKNYQLVLCQQAGNPVSSTNAVERTHRAPTGQDYLDKYTDYLGIGSRRDGTDHLFVCFGGEKIENAKRVYAVAGKYNGEAIVWLQSKSGFLDQNAGQQAIQNDLKHEELLNSQESQACVVRRRHARENGLQD